VNTVDPKFFEENIPNAYKMRKLNDIEKKQRSMEISKYILDVIQGSNQITSGIGDTTAFSS
jgi:C4-type Zn-finger protein